MTVDDDDDDNVAPPPGVRLRDPNDTDGIRDDIEQGVMSSMQKYVHGYEYGGTRLELSDMAYRDKPRFTLEEQREALMKDTTLARRLKGTVTLVDMTTNKPLEVRKNVTLARVPYLTQRGTMIHNGSEYAPCFHGTTKIWTEHGLMEIRKIVNGRLPVRVWSWDFATGKLALRQVTNWFIRPSPNGVGRLAMRAPKGMHPELMKGKTNFSTVWCTPEHNIYAPDGSKLPASETPTVSMVLARMNTNQRQMLIGTMLGDGTIQAPGVYRVGQCAAQRDYVEVKRRIMLPFLSDTGKAIRDGFSHTLLPGDKLRGDLVKKSFAKCSFETCGFVEMGEWRRSVYPDGVRNLDTDWFREGDERALAFWFCDDGSARYQRTTNSPSVTLHTNNFTSKDVDKLRSWLCSKWGIESRVSHKYGKQHVSGTDRMISITGDACWNFLELVAPYVPDCLRYKLLDRPKTAVCRNNCGNATDPNRKVCTPCYYTEIKATPGPLSKSIRVRFGDSETARLAADRGDAADDAAILTRWQRIQDSAGTAIDAMTSDAQPLYELREIPTSYGLEPEMQYAKARKVFDIEVDGTHNYFANGVLVSNCAQSRLLPGVYTRKTNNGTLESHFNTRPGTGSAMRMTLDPTTGVYRLKVGSSNVHAYSVFKDLGVSDEELTKRWGPEILETNRVGYDSRAVDRVYNKAIPKWLRDPALTREEKAAAVSEAFSRAQVAKAVLKDNLPNLFSREKAAAWRFTGLAIEKAARMAVELSKSASHGDFRPDRTPAELLGELGRFDFEQDEPLLKSAGWRLAVSDSEDDPEQYEGLVKWAAEFNPDLEPTEMRESYNSIYGRTGPRLASMKEWPEHWLNDTDPKGWLEWYENYHDGRRDATDAKQIRRWASFKAKHGTQFQIRPTPRRAFALVNWAIDPLELLPKGERADFELEMERYRRTEYMKWALNRYDFDQERTEQLLAKARARGSKLTGSTQRSLMAAALDGHLTPDDLKP